MIESVSFQYAVIAQNAQTKYFW